MLFDAFSLIFERPEEGPRGLETTKWHPTAFCGAEIFSWEAEIFLWEAEIFLWEAEIFSKTAEIFSWEAEIFFTTKRLS